MTERWHLHRAGVFNFWYYDEEEIQFTGGKLLLRGTNGSGKSVTMQSLIPVLLDGRKSPDRLDPFGSRARRMEDYLLGEEEVSELDERTGYLYLEFKRSDNQYLTIGMGLKAKRQSRLDSWGFVIWDNRRIGHELQLYKTEINVAGAKEKIPLSWRELEYRLGEGGKIARGQEEYMSLVNRYLFGFKALDEYNDLMKLLIQLRSPKLSKDFRPTVIFDILNESLPSLSDEELRPLSETIENMDQTKSQLDQIIREEQALKRLSRVYDQYNRRVRLEKAEGLLKARKWQDDNARKLTDEQAAFAQGDEDFAGLQIKEQELEQESEVLNKEKEALQEHDVFKAEQEKVGIETELKDVKEKYRRKQEQFTEKQAKERETTENIKTKENKLDKAQQEIDDNLEEMDFLAEEAGFLNHEVAVAEFRQNREREFSFILWKKEGKDYEARLEAALTAFRAETQAKEKHAEADRELGEVRKAWEEAQFEERKWAEVLNDERQKWRNDFFTWHHSNTELKLEDSTVQTVAKRIWLCPEEMGWDALQEPVAAAKEEARQSFGNELLDLKHQLGQKTTQIKETEGRIEEWRQKKDPEPPRHPATDEARRLLKNEGISYLPFYAGVEFLDTVTPEMRERLEAALSQAGILDALIVPDTYFKAPGNKTIANDRILYPQPQILAHTLADYLYPTPVEGSAVSVGDIDNVLCSILVGEAEGGDNSLGDPSVAGKTTVSLQGKYSIGLVAGHAPAAEASIYIGKESRRRYRLKEIARLEEELAGLRQEMEDLESDKQRAEARLQKLEEEYRHFPLIKGLKEAYDFLDSARREVRQEEKEVGKKDQKVKEALDHWNKVKAELRELTRAITLVMRQEIYEEAISKHKRYREHLTQVELEYGKVTAARSEIRIYRGNLEELISQVDELKGELNGLSSEENLLRKRLESVEKRLQELGAEEIRARIKAVVDRLVELPHLQNKNRDDLFQLRNEQKNRSAKIQQLQKETEWAISLMDAWYQVFGEEEKIQQSFEQYGADKQAEPGASPGAPELLKQAREIFNTAEEKTTAGTDRETLQTRLTDAVFREMGNLVEYRLSQQTTCEMSESSGLDPAFAEEEEFEKWTGRWNDLKSKARRSQLVLEYDGKKVSPYFVLDRMAKDISLQQQILNEKDRELYEEIIMNSVGRIIRGRIERAEHWVDEMNKLMEERDTSSGLRLAIRWKARTAEHEDELDTKDLVDLLKADPRLLKESDMTRITTHFRTKIERAKQVLEQKGFGESFHQIIKEMLDYRKWFAFSLLYQIEGGRWKELTDRAFYTFSGGEKAMAMYIPLFSAAYSRYSDARPEAPRIISLDEAFAGVDENNIRDMFDLLEKLGFDYIMNSQALWGDYDTVSSLAIVELVRPKNASFVTLIRYLWDGKVRRLAQ